MRRRPAVLVTVLALGAPGLAAVAAPVAAAAAHPASSAPVQRAAEPGRTGPRPGWGATTRPALAHGPTGAVAARPAGSVATGLVAAGASTTAPIEVTVSGPSTSAVTRAVQASHGQVLAGTAGRVTAVVAPAQLPKLDANAAVATVQRPVRAFVQDTPTSEAVALSNAGPTGTAGTWQADGTDGTGVTVGIVDAGFGGLAAAIADKSLPAGTTFASADNHCAHASTETHGTAVAEIVHQMAPGATLRLYCIDDSVGMNTVVPQLVGDHVTIVNCSLAFPGDSRGDGTGSSGSAAVAVRTARRDGILWVNSAGNSGEDHWYGTFADTNKDKLADLYGTHHEQDGEFVPGTRALSGGGVVDAILQWDQWPTSSAPVELFGHGYQCSDSSCSKRTPISKTITATQVKKTAPVLGFEIKNTKAYPQVWFFQVRLGRGFPKVHYDLDYEGDANGSYLASLNATHAAANSISQPADSPYVLAVGAADAGVDGKTPGTLEPFSAHGPTIDGRTKPDITGWDGVSSPVYGVPNSGDKSGKGFYGTSAAAPSVAGAAALVASADPNLDAAQLQAFLQSRASNGKPSLSRTDSVGAGRLTLGASPAASPLAAPAGARYTALPTPVRILDTRTGTGVTKGKAAAGQALVVSVPGLPADATAVAVTLTGANVTATTKLTAYPYGAADPGTSTVSLSTTDPTVGDLAVVDVRSGKFVVSNYAGTANVIIEEAGYFGTGAETGRYTPLAVPDRVLDTRTSTGDHPGNLAVGGDVRVDPAAPADATAAIIDVTTTGAAASGYLTAASTCTKGTITNTFTSRPRTGLAIVGLDASAHFCVHDTGAAVGVVVDVVGYFGANGSEYHGLPSPTRIVDTRTGNGLYGAGEASRPLGAGTVAAFYGADVGLVPAAATALIGTITEASTTTRSGYLGVFAGVTRPATVRPVSIFSAGRSVGASVVPALSGAHHFGIYNQAGSTQVILDVSGYFLPASG